MKKAKLSVVVIDPVNQTVERMTIPSETGKLELKQANEIIGSSMIERVGINQIVDMVIDEEGLYAQKVIGFSFKGGNQGMHFAGKAILVGFNEEGDWVSAPSINLENLYNAIVWRNEEEMRAYVDAMFGSGGIRVTTI